MLFPPLPVLFPVKAVPLAVFFGSFTASYTLLRVALSRLIFRLTGGDPYGLPSSSSSSSKRLDSSVDPSPYSSSAEIAALEANAPPPKPRERIHPLATFLAGTLAGTAVLLDSEKHGRERRVTLALYLFIRVVEVAGESGVKRGILPSFYHADTALFTLSCTEIMYSWFFTPETLPPAYDRWITKLAAMDFRLMNYLRQKQQGNLPPGAHSDLLLSYALDNHLDPAIADPGNGFIQCVVVGVFSATLLFASRSRIIFLFSRITRAVANTVQSTPGTSCGMASSSHCSSTSPSTFSPSFSGDLGP